MNRRFESGVSGNLMQRTDPSVTGLDAKRLISEPGINSGLQLTPMDPDK